MLAAIIATNPMASIGFTPNRVVRLWASPAHRTALPAVTTNVNPVLIAL